MPSREMWANRQILTSHLIIESRSEGARQDVRRVLAAIFYTAVGCGRLRTFFQGLAVPDPAFAGAGWRVRNPGRVRRRHVASGSRFAK